MMPNKISFFQFYHNGDGFVCKEYIRQIIKELPNFEFEYLHNNHPKSLVDLGIPCTGSPSFIAKSGKHAPRFLKKQNQLYIHTWIGAYGSRHGDPVFFFKEGINHNILIQIWEHIYSQINNQFGTSLKIKSKEDYIGEIDFSYFDIAPIQEFLKNKSGKKILFSNGNPMSKQSFNGDMSDIIQHLAEKFPLWEFYCTNKFSTTFDNIFFTDDIIPSRISDNLEIPEWSRKICDLNEISFLSESCDIIVGKNSGPFIYCITKNNLFKQKTIISFNRLETDSILKDLNIDANYIWSNNFNVDNMKSIIEKEIIRY